MAGQGTAIGRRVVVIGASVAGLRCAQALRSSGFIGAITLVGDEPHRPYDRPPLSKSMLASEWSDEALDRIWLATDAEQVTLRLDLRLGVPAVALDLDRRRVALADGTDVDYDVLVLATGARARPAPWQPASGLYTLRTLDDARTLSTRFSAREPVVVVGGGFIGTEVAASARHRGCPVTVVDPVRRPMARLVGPDLADALVGLHHRHGTETRFGVGVVSVEGSEGDLEVLLDDGTRLAAGTVVVGIGSVPNTDWLIGSGVTLENGVGCDEFLRVRRAADVFAIGDVARWPHPGLGQEVRSEHWTNAVDQARHVAGSIVDGVTEPFCPNDYVWSDQYDWKVQVIGWRDACGRSVLIGDLEADGRAALVHESADGVVVGCVALNWPKALLQGRRMIAQHLPASSVADALGLPLA